MTLQSRNITSSEQEARCTLRISRDLRDKIAAAAEENSRSLNREIEFRIDDYDRIVNLLRQASSENGIPAPDLGSNENTGNVHHEVKRSIRKMGYNSTVTNHLVLEQTKRIDGLSSEISAIRQLLEGALRQALTGR